MSYGIIGKGQWRNRYDVEFAKLLKKRNDLKIASAVWRNSWVNRAVLEPTKHRIDNLTLEPFLIADRFLLHPLVNVYNRWQKSWSSDGPTGLIRQPHIPYKYRLNLPNAASPSTTITQSEGEESDANGGDLLAFEHSANTERNLSLLVPWKGGIKRRLQWCVLTLRHTWKNTSVFGSSNVRTLLKFYARYGQSPDTPFSILELYRFFEHQFLPQVLQAANAFHKSPAAAAWLKQHAAPHVVSLLTTLQSAPSEIYGSSVRDNMEFLTMPLYVQYEGCFANSYAKKLMKNTVEVENLRAHLPGVLVSTNLRTYSANAISSPLSSGPKTLTIAFAICPHPNPALDDPWPLYLQDANLINLEQLRF